MAYQNMIALSQKNPTQKNRIPENMAHTKKHEFRLFNLVFRFFKVKMPGIWCGTRMGIMALPPEAWKHILSYSRHFWHFLPVIGELFAKEKQGQRIRRNCGIWNGVYVGSGCLHTCGFCSHTKHFPQSRGSVETNSNDYLYFPLQCETNWPISPFR